MAAPALSAHRPKRQASSLHLRMPRADWPKLCQGTKTEMRLRCGRGTPVFHAIVPPTPVIGFSTWRDGTDMRLFLLEDVWREPLSAISAESLAREGYDSLEAFKRYWRARERDIPSKRRMPRGWAPLAKVMVYRVRPFREDDIEPQALRLLYRLYGDFLPDGDLES